MCIFNGLMSVFGKDGEPQFKLSANQIKLKEGI